DAGGEIVCGFGRFVSGQYTDSVFFIYRVIFSEGKRSAELRFGSDDGIKVWFNGKEVLSNDIQRSMLRDQDKAGVTFNKGANRLLIRINNGRSGGGFIFRVTDAVGTPIVVDLEGTLQ
ncbi:MAG: hypothetical protein QF662_09265, partial [Phycisphaerae bacterium]|nr:hypothetical protein [Phycisphaerae bacterium]